MVAIVTSTSSLRTKLSKVNRFCNRSGSPPPVSHAAASVHVCGTHGAGGATQSRQTAGCKKERGAFPPPLSFAPISRSEHVAQAELDVAAIVGLGGNLAERSAARSA